MKKIWVLSIALMITAIIGAACSGDAATPTRPPTATSPAPTATSPAMVEATATAPATVDDDHDDVAIGQGLYTSLGCLACHSIDGSAIVGPSWKGLYGSIRPLADGTSVTADDVYIKESITNPAAKVAEGFPPIMPPFTLTDDDLHAIVAYIESLK
ncbi:MAG: c-type cytochrome [Chloroflexi bacterium]|nr:c-type cytochrome [Chloroflexota bacterium]